jgi:hypothetical protein
LESCRRHSMCLALSPILLTQAFVSALYGTLEDASMGQEMHSRTRLSTKASTQKTKPRATWATLVTAMEPGLALISPQMNLLWWSFSRSDLEEQVLDVTTAFSSILKTVLRARLQAR